jgi:hypothetical protein
MQPETVLLLGGRHDNRSESKMRLSRPICLLAAMVLIAACRNPSTENPPIGEPVTIQFRRDALGSAHNLPVPPTTHSINGAQVSLSGRLSAVTPEWIVVEYEAHDHWISRDTVLLIRHDRKRKSQ